MILHPWHLHATAALWSLAAAWPLLLSAESHAAAAYADDHGYVQAWRPNVGRGATLLARDGRLATSALTAGPVGVYRALRDRGEWALAAARWLIVSCGLGKPRTWAEFAAGITAADGRTARDVGAELWPADDTIRKGLHLMPDLWQLPENPACPSCSVRLLHAHTAAPDSAQWTVVCLAGCRCRGDECPCGMLVREQGVPHIWLGPPKEA